MEFGYVDLHTHTLASDGTHSPAEQVHLAKSAGLSAVAITDHDTVAGIDEAEREGERIGIEVVPGVEISTVAGGQDIHILGYYFDRRDPTLLQRLERLRETRAMRNELIVDKLRKLGISVTMGEVIANLPGELGPDETVGRPHIADLLVRKGYAANMQEAFDKYLAKHAAAYVDLPRIEPTTAVDWIHEAGGKAVLAHPGLYNDDSLIDRLIAYGIDGIETTHPDNSPEQEARYAALTVKYSLIATAGSDYHGERQGKVFHAPIGSRKIGTDVLERLGRRDS